LQVRRQTFLPSFSIFEIMHGIFAHACRYEWLLNNPINLVRQEREAGEKCLTFWMKN
jgi:hypothetical protein